MKRSLNIDFSSPLGRAKPICGVNLGPLSSPDLSVDFSEEYRRLSVPYVRVSDVEPPFGGGRFVDVHCIFPDFSLDERFEQSYRFGPTDKYLSAIKQSGGEIMLRLGESFDPSGDYRPEIFPRDFEKWASVAERIVAHYNLGWGNGMKLGIKMVEIWCESDRVGSVFSGVEEYAEFYRTVATRLKKKFPRLKIGCYSSGGFAGLNHFDADGETKGFVSFLEKFIALITEGGREAPLDFLSWKCFAEAPEEISLHANYARSYLNTSGHKKAMSVISEFNMKQAIVGSAYRAKDYPAELASAFIIAQKSNVDMMFYSDLGPRSLKNAIFTLDDNRVHRRYASFEVLSAVGRIYRLGRMINTSEDYRRELYTMASADDGGATLILSSRDFQGEIDLVLRDCPYRRYSIMGLVGGGERGEGRVSRATDIPLNSDKISIRAGKNEVYIVDFAP